MPENRAAAVESVRSLMGETRLVTLTGPGGVGKTRLAIETARRLGNAWLVEFTDRSSPSDDWVYEVTAAALGIRDDPGASGSLADRLAEALASNWRSREKMARSPQRSPDAVAGIGRAGVVDKTGAPQLH